MSEFTTTANIKLGDCVLEFSGNETFVQKQIDEFKGLIHGNIKQNKGNGTKSNSNSNPGEKTEVDNDPLSNSTENPYPNVIDYNGEKINILKVDGKKKSEKTRKLALMYVWAKKQIQIENVPKKELESLCEHHECYDNSNFKKYLKKTSGIILDGKKQNYTVRLTAPGIKKAEALLEKLNEKG